MKKIITGLFVFALVFSFSSMNTEKAFAQTSNETVSYQLGNQTLRNGSRGEAARELQRFLNDTLNMGLVLDGIIGPKTIAVMKEWQRERGLVADGLIGPKTKVKILESAPARAGESAVGVASSPVVYPPSITVLSPNGGETYTPGQQVMVKWDTKNYIGNISEINLNSINGWGGGQGATLSKDLENDGSEIVPIPNLSDFLAGNISLGKYFKIEVVAGNTSSNNIMRDSSDDTFTINSISTGTPFCTDSDGGINLNVAGFTDGRVNGIGSSFNDSSVGTNGGSCSGTNCTGVAEGFCENGIVKNLVYQCPSGYSVNGACTPKITTPSVTVLSPNGGETFTAGQQITARWESNNIFTSDFKVSMLLLNAASPTPVFLKNTSGATQFANDGSEVVVLPSNLTSGTAYKLRISLLKEGDYNSVSGESGLFTVNSSSVPPPANASIRILSPNGGESFAAGQQIPVSWTSVSLSSSDTLQVGLIKDVSGMYYSLTSSTLNDGRETFTIPSSVQIGQYKMHIRKGGTTTEDLSDSSFAITAPPVIVPSVSMLSPNGGEAYTGGQQMTLRWETKNVPTSATVNLYLVRELPDPQSSVPSYPRQAIIAENIPNSGSYTWTINNALLTATNYLVLIDGRITGENAGYFVDLSDGLFTINASATANIDTTPRIMYFYGKVNQHTDANGNWLTDPDGVSGANIDQLTYCKKWFPNTTSIANHKLETIDTWRDAGNTGAYTSTKLSIKCVGGAVSSSTLGSLMQASALGAFNSATNTVQQKPQVNTNTNANTNANVSSCGEFTTTLKKGMEDPQVKCLQKMLNQKGFKIRGIAEGNETNFFGTRTLEALKAFQAQNGLDSDGIFGSASRKALVN